MNLSTAEKLAAELYIDTVEDKEALKLACKEFLGGSLTVDVKGHKICFPVSVIYNMLAERAKSAERQEREPA